MSSGESQTSNFQVFPMLADKSARELLNAFASSAPTPGGGSAAALASAVGASLLQMVASLPKTRSNTDDDRAALAAASSALIGIRAQLTDAIDADSGAYDQVVAAYKLAKSSAAEQSARKSAIQRALRAAPHLPPPLIRLPSHALHQPR